MRPPRLSRWMTARLAPPDVRASLVDDLDEAFGREVARRGRTRARWWYRRQVVAGAWALLKLRARRSHHAAPPAVSSSLAEGVWQDLRYAARSLRAAPGFTTVVLLSLALGIGANTAVFSVVNPVLLRPLPYPDADRIVVVTPPEGGIGNVNLPQFSFVRDQASIFSSVGARNRWNDVSISAGGDPEWVKSMTVSADYFRTLGVVPAIGREFNAEETRLGGPVAVVITDAVWRRVFGADPLVVGRTAALGNMNYPIVGVLPRDFWLPITTDVFVPLQPTGGSSDKGLNTEMIARLAPGVTFARASAEMTALSQRFVRDSPDGKDDSFRGLRVVPYQQVLVGDVRTNLWLLFGAVAALLLIACSNLGSLLFARFTSRQREIAIRLAIGASPARLLRQFAVENLLLGATGSAAGIVVAYSVLDSFVALMPFALPLSSPIRIDLAALGFAIGAGLLTAMAFSVVPLVISSRRETTSALQAGARAHGGSRRSQRARSVLVVTEISLSVCLLVGAALLIESLYRLHHEPLGFSTDNRLTFFTPAPEAARRSVDARWAFDEATAERLRNLPGVIGVAGTNVVPLTSQSNFPAERVGDPDNAIGGMEIRIVTPSYFDVMNTPVRRGRAFTTDDTVAATPVILVNETLARRWWREASPLGDRIVIGRYKGQTIGGGPGHPPREVVGVVADTKTVYVKSPPRPTVYVPAAQAPWVTGGTTWVVHGHLETGLAERVREAIRAADPRQRIDRMQTMERIVAATRATSRFDAWLCGALAMLALALTVIGIYGVLAFSVARRTSEIGVRIALGATRSTMMRAVIGQGLRLTVIGVVLGLTAATWLSRFITSLLFGVGPTHVTSFVGVALLLVGVGIAASALPARRAASVDPLTALRME